MELVEELGPLAVDGENEGVAGLLGGLGLDTGEDETEVAGTESKPAVTVAEG